MEDKEEKAIGLDVPGGKTVKEVRGILRMNKDATKLTAWCSGNAALCTMAAALAEEPLEVTEVRFDQVWATNAAVTGLMRQVAPTVRKLDFKICHTLTFNAELVEPMHSMPPRTACSRVKA